MPTINKSKIIENVIEQLEFKFEVANRDFMISRDLGNGVEIRIKKSWSQQQEYFIYVWKESQMIDFKFIESMENLKTACDSLYNKYRLQLVS